MSDLKFVSIPEEKYINGLAFPLTMSPTESIKTINDAIFFLKSNLNPILAKLLQHGSILFRGFPINDAKDFNDFALAFGWADLPYIGYQIISFFD